MEYYGSLDYGNSMDRGYGSLDLGGNPSIPWAEKVDISEIGISTPPMKDQLQSLKARIFQGAKKVELGFWGKGKGSKGQGATTPEQMDTWHRRDIKELAELNKVKLSTHVSPAVGNLSGLTQQGFLDEEREKAMNEIKRTIDFAADTTNGGAVVVHLGEFPRALTEQEEWDRDKKGGPMFKMYPTEAEHAKQYVVDSRTGKFVGEISKDQVVYEPKWMTAKDWERVKMADGKRIVGSRDANGRIVHEDDWVDLNGNVIPKDADPELLFNRRVPLWNSEKANFEAQKRDWSYFKKEADRWNKQHPGKKKTPAMVFYETQLDNQILQNKGSSMFYAHNYDEYRDMLKKAKEAYEEYQRLEKTIPEKERWKLAIEKAFRGYQVASLMPREREMPTEALNRFIQETERQMRFMHEAAAAADARAAEMLDQKQRLKPLEDYAKNKTADTIARAAEYAMVKSEKTKEPLYISPENIFPETYGSHPEELREIIKKSREAFAKRLLEMKRVRSEKEAKELAEKHIRATFDIGHVYTWRKYFVGSDKEFEKWIWKELEKLNKDRIIGHIHVSDNFGYEDEHVTPGRGKVPIKEFIEKMKKAGHTDIIVEPADQDYLAVLGAWGMVGRPIYGVANGGLGWTEIEHSYFGRTAPPYFLYGDTAPSPQEWTLWSGVKLE